MPIYTSCACNRVPRCLDWGRNGLVCYGACHAVAIFEPAKTGVAATLHHHGNKISAVEWIKPRENGPEKELISASVDGSAVIWTRENAGEFSATSVIEGKDPLSICATLTESDDSLLILTGSIITPTGGAGVVQNDRSRLTTLSIFYRETKGRGIVPRREMRSWNLSKDNLHSEIPIFPIFEENRRFFVFYQRHLALGLD